MRNPEETAKAILAGEPAEGLMDEIRPLAESYLKAVDGLRDIAKWARIEDVASDAQHTLDAMEL